MATLKNPNQVIAKLKKQAEELRGTIEKELEKPVLNINRARWVQSLMKTRDHYIDIVENGPVRSIREGKDNE